MLSYQHMYHAGNLADVHKHATLFAVLKILGKQALAVDYLESHAGRGRYDLQGKAAAKTGEWLSGIAALVQADALAPIYNQYRKFVLGYSRAKSADGLRVYHGSPVIAQRLLTRRDTLTLFDLHPQEFKALSAALDQDPRVTAVHDDGLAGILALSDRPVDPRRLRVGLIDPSYEQAGEFDGVLEVAEAARLEVLLAWFPRLGDGRHEALENHFIHHGVLSSVAFNAPNPKATPGKRMFGSGMGLILRGVKPDLSKTLRRQLTLVTRGFEAWILSQGSQHSV